MEKPDASDRNVYVTPDGGEKPAAQNKKSSALKDILQVLAVVAVLLAGCAAMIFQTMPGSLSFSSDRQGETWTLKDGVLTISQVCDSSMWRNGTNYNEVTQLRQHVENHTEEIVIENGVTKIGDYMFSGWQALTAVTIRDGVTTIGNQTFNACTALTSVTIPASVTEIGDYAFLFCSALTDVYYTGSRSEWNDISVGEGNFALTGAVLHCSG